MCARDERLTESAMSSEAGRDVSTAGKGVRSAPSGNEMDWMRTRLFRGVFGGGLREGGPERPWPQSEFQQLVQHVQQFLLSHSTAKHVK